MNPGYFAVRTFKNGRNRSRIMRIRDGDTRVVSTCMDLYDTKMWVVCRITRTGNEVTRNWRIIQRADHLSYLLFRKDITYHDLLSERVFGNFLLETIP